MATLDEAIAKVKTGFGKKVLQTVHDKLEDTIIPTGIYEFDKASELGGCPLGKIIEVAGPPSSGKTTLSWQVASELARKTGKKILFFDFEMNASKKWLTKLNVPVEQVYFAMPELAEKTDNQTDKANMLSIEDAFSMMDILLETKAFCAVIWDSVANSSASSSLNRADKKGLDADEVAAAAKALEKCLRLCGPFYRKYGTTLFFINHQRTNFDPNANPYMAKFMDKTRTPGGTAFKHQADMRIELFPLGFIKKAAVDSTGKKVEVKIGQEIKLSFIKNRVGEPFGSETMVMRKGIGFDVITSLIKRAIDKGVVVRKTTGNTYLRDDENVKAPSFEGFWNLVFSNKELQNIIKAKLDGQIINVDKTKINLDSGTKELTLKELTGSDVVLEDTGELKAIHGTTELSKEASNVNLDSLLEEKIVLPVKPLEQEAEPFRTESKPEIKKKRGRPAKVK